MEVSGQLHAPAPSFQRKQAPGTQRTGGCVDPGAGMDAVEKRQISCPWRESNLASQIVQPVVFAQYRLRYPGFNKFVLYYIKYI
jgi:hypothetical protein